MLSRKSDWLEQLTRYLIERRSRSFEWGANDCALFVCDAVAAMTGSDLAAEARGKYDTEAGAAAFLAAATSGGGLAEYARMIATRNGMEEIPLAMARRGDIVLWDCPGTGPSLGIVGLDGIFALFAGPSGISKNKVRQCTTAWRVG